VPASASLASGALLSWVLTSPAETLAACLAHLVRRYYGTQARDVRLERMLEDELQQSSLAIDRGLVADQSSPSQSASRREQTVLLANAPSLLDFVDPNPLGPQSGLVDTIGAGLLGGLRTIDPTIGYSSQALGHLAATDLFHLHLPWWNPYEGTGVPLAGAALVLDRPEMAAAADRAGIAQSGDCLCCAVHQAVDVLPDQSGLLEFVLDLGREPEARFAGREVSLGTTPVTHEDIEHVLSRIGALLWSVASVLTAIAPNVGLLFAARSPAQHRSLIGVVALGSVLLCAAVLIAGYHFGAGLSTHVHGLSAQQGLAQGSWGEYIRAQRAGSGRRAQERLRGWPQAQESELGSRPWANAARGPPIGIGQIAEGHLARTDWIVADDLGTGVADDHLVFVSHHFDALADERFRHQVPRGPQPNTAALIHGACFGGAQRWTS